jgi:hypothetical protein
MRPCSPQARYARIGWKRWWQQIEAATNEKVRRNLRTGRPLH